MVHPEERRKVVLAFLCFFLLLCSYYILRPVRDEMGIRTGVNKLQWLFTGTFIATLVIVPIFGFVAARIPRRKLLPWVYAFFIVNLAAFYAAFAADVSPVGTAITFFIWLSVFNLFVVSLFWSLNSDVFSTEQSHRVYGVIAAGGSAGALTGPALTALLATRVATAHLIAISGVLLTAALACAAVLARSAKSDVGDPSRPMGGTTLAGIRLTLKSRTLLGIALLIVCYTTVSTILYFSQAEIVSNAITDSGQRTAWFARLDLATNVLAITVQALITRQFVRKLGLRWTLVIVPLLVAIGLLVLGTLTLPLIVAIVQVVHRAGDFALMRPGREMIYTTVGAESRYKAKSFIDTTVYRANDALAGWLVAAGRGAGLDAAGLALAGIPVALLWLGTGRAIGRRHDEGRTDEA